MRTVFGWLVVSVTFPLMGCLPGGSSNGTGGPRGDGLSGGSVPRGGDVDVQIVQAEGGARALSLDVPQAGGRDWLTTPSWQSVTGAVVNIKSHDGRIWYPNTASGGHYRFAKLAPGSATLQVDPPRGVAGLAPRSLGVDITQDKPISLIVWLGAAVSDARVDSLRIDPSTVTIAPGETTHFSVDVEGLNVDRLWPAWTFHGVGGQISPDGTFTATELGLGVVIVTMGDQSASAVVVVDDSISQIINDTGSSGG